MGSYFGPVTCSDGTSFPNYGIGIGKLGSQTDGVVIDLLCCPQLNFPGTASGDGISVDAEVSVAFNFCGAPITLVRMRVNFKLDASELVTSNMRLQYFTSPGEMACNITCEGVLEKN